MSRKNNIGFVLAMLGLLSFPFHAGAEEVKLPDSMKGCFSSDQCVIIDKHCGDCCHYDAVNKKMRDQAMELKAQSCKKYRGGKCDCAQPPMEARCVSSLCEAKKTEGNK